MRKEIGIAAGIIGAAALFYEASRYSFSKEIATKILERDSFTCQGIDRKYDVCVWEVVQGVPANREEGIWTEASHWSHNKKHPDYNKEKQGRCQCLACHYLYSRSLNRFGDADMIKMRGVFTYDFINHPDSYPAMRRYRHFHTVIDVLKDASHRLRQLNLTYLEARPKPIPIDPYLLRVSKIAGQIPVYKDFDPVEYYGIY